MLLESSAISIDWPKKTDKLQDFVNISWLAICYNLSCTPKPLSAVAKGNRVTVLIVLAVAWLATTLAITVLLLGARRSHLIYRMLFGPKPMAEVHQLVTAPSPPTTERAPRLVA